MERQSSKTQRSTQLSNSAPSAVTTATLLADTAQALPPTIVWLVSEATTGEALVSAMNALSEKAEPQTQL